MSRRGTSNTNARGSTRNRRARKVWLLETFGDGTSAPCMAEAHHRDCPGVVVFETITAGRIVPGCEQGAYRRGNIRPEFGLCNSRHGGLLAHRDRTIPMSMKIIYEAAERAGQLVRGLEQSDRDVDRHQVAAGVRHELNTILMVAGEALSRAATAATEDRPGKVRADAPGTSRAAAQAITLKTGTARLRVLLELWDEQERHGWEQRHGLADLDLQDRLGLNPSTERPRRGELVDAGLVEAVGERPIAGSSWTVWGITQAGVDALVTASSRQGRVVAAGGQPTLF